MVASTLVETLTQFGVIIAIAIFVIVMLAMGASGTSIGRYMVPQAVIDVMSKLLPSSFITDATATAYGDFQLDMSGNARLKKVNVHRSDGMTIAWAFDPTIEFPQTGTFALNSFRHNLKSSSVSLIQRRWKCFGERLRSQMCWSMSTTPRKNVAPVQQLQKC
ncbi:hypothetical protein [Aureliella helgolandensis]|uniref:Uncharacterized protein n=1 Tax=Aureliella helgolandensis TaxID=2527968 RepID=A0A518G6H7_9BACT|nr:hypothetical protein [Aureliella helgolandensis]QDV24192.1 hypothetical protein Q31a_25060 [Aureliella helgolandensis]